MLHVNDTNEQIVYLRSCVIGCLENECVKVFLEHEEEILEGTFEGTLIDHIGGAFFPEVGVFRWIGRLAFPIFCYCLTVGLMYTHDIRRYLGRLWNCIFSNVMVGSGERL